MSFRNQQPLTVTLEPHVLDALADWLRADGKRQHLAIEVAKSGQSRDWTQQDIETRLLGEFAARALSGSIPTTVQGDLAEAFAEQHAAHEAFRAYKKDHP